jgi:hypothetical protein
MSDVQVSRGRLYIAYVFSFSILSLSIEEVDARGRHIDLVLVIGKCGHSFHMVSMRERFACLGESHG